MPRISAFGALLAATVFLGPAALAQQGGLTVDQAWSRAAAAGRTGVVYLTVTDTGAPDRLIAVTTPVATRAELHESFTEQGIMKMRPVAALPVEPGKPITLAPGGYHIMLVQLTRPLANGDRFPLTLTFEKAGAVIATVAVSKSQPVPMQHHTGG